MSTQAISPLVGTLATDDTPGTVVRLGEPASLIAPLSPGQGVAALIRHPVLPVLYGLTMGPEGRLFCWGQAGEQHRLLADLPTYGTVPCHLAIDPRAEFLVITNYGTGSITVFGLDAEGVPGIPSWMETLGDSGPDPDRQERSHTHHVAFIGDDLLLINDLGGDRIVSFRIDRRTGRLVRCHASAMPAGSGPRHLALLADGMVAISGELDSTVILGRLHQAGAVEVVGVHPSSWRPEVRDQTEVSLASDIVGDRDTVYVANRGYNTVAALSVRGGTLSPIDEYHCRGDWPQHLGLSRDALLIACQRSDQVTIWSREPDGSLRFDRSSAVSRPAWIADQRSGVEIDHG